MRPSVVSEPARDRAIGGPIVGIRPIAASDVSRLEAFYAALSAESRRTRFLSFSSGLSHALATSFCMPDHDHEEGFVATILDLSGVEQIVGHLCLEPDTDGAIEVAVAVADDLQRRGIGRRLLRTGARWAREAGFRRLRATMFAANAAIQRLLVGLGAPVTVRDLGAGITEVTIDLAARAPAGGPLTAERAA